MSFEESVDKVHKLAAKPENDELLELYALYKQDTEGDNQGPEPDMWDFKEKFKWVQWNKKKGMSKEEASQKYVLYVDQLVAKYGVA